MGKRLHVNPDERYKLLVEVDLLAHGHPAFRPRPMYYNVLLGKLISHLRAIFSAATKCVKKASSLRFLLFLHNFSLHPPWVLVACAAIHSSCKMPLYTDSI